MTTSHAKTQLPIFTVILTLVLLFSLKTEINIYANPTSGAVKMYWTDSGTKMDGQPRIQEHCCDMGCYEKSLSTSPAIQAPTNLKAAVISSFRIDLSWQDSSDNEDGFEIFRRRDTGTFTPIAVPT
jgi:hypothetical protein